MTEEKIKIDFRCPLSFLLLNRQEEKIAKGKANALLEKEKLCIRSESGETFNFPLREILGILEKNYHISLPLISHQRLDLFNLGYKFEDFLKALCKCYNELILQDMLVKEILRKKDIEANFTQFDSKEEKIAGGKCETRIYETSVIIIPQKGNILRIPLGHIDEIKPENYSITIFTDFGEKILLSHMGYQLDPFKKVLTDLLTQLSQKTQAFLQELLPTIDSNVIRKISHYLKEGKMAKRKDIESISPTVWKEMEKKIIESPLADEYAFLKSLGHEDKIAIGFKRGLMRGLNQDYFWFLVPIPGNKPGEPGNAAVFEAGNINLPAPPSQEQETGIQEEEPGEETILKQEGKATYFFRIIPRSEYAQLKDPEALPGKVDDFITNLNRCMQEVNFRREPVYLSEKKLSEPNYIKYRYAIQRLPGLQLLRNLFIGRVKHQSEDQWKKDSAALLTFNTQSRDDNEKWQKGEGE